MRFFLVLMLAAVVVNIGSGAKAASYTEATVSAIVLDINDDGIETTGVKSKEVMFDFDGDGVKIRTGWISPADGFLAYDRNGDGRINNGQELFGNKTRHYKKPGFCRNGYQALAQQDTNGDGLVNHLDDNWRHLKIWRDLNQNGVTNEGELFNLDELGITGFKVESGGPDVDQNDNILRGEGVYYDATGKDRLFSDVWFAQNLFYSRFPNEKTPENLHGLPLMNGSGKVPPIIQACARSETLAEIYRQMAAAEGRRDKLALVDNLLYEWANTSGMISTYAARKTYADKIIHNNLPMPLEEWDRILHVVQAFNGRYMVDAPDLRRSTKGKTITVDWTEVNINKILKAYDALRKFAYGAVATQTHLSKYENVVITNVDPEVAYDYTLVEYYFSRALESENRMRVLEDLLDFQQVSSYFRKESTWEADELIVKILHNMKMTPELRALCEEFKLNVRGRLVLLLMQQKAETLFATKRKTGW